MTAEQIQASIAIATIPVAVLFIGLYWRDGWHRNLFGWSLMLIAVAVLLYSTSTALFRLFGGGYPGRDLLLISSSGLTFAAMVTRTYVLWAATRRPSDSMPHL